MTFPVQYLRDCLDFHCQVGRGDWSVRVDPRSILCSSAVCQYVSVVPPEPKHCIDEANRVVWLKAVFEDHAQSKTPYEDVIDLTVKTNRIVLALDIFLGTILFQQCYPTEPMSSYFWRTNNAKWIARVDRLMGEGHCRLSYEHSRSHLFDAPEYRA